MAGKKIRIGGSSGFWGDTEVAAVQLVRHGDIDYLINDYLAEITMSIMAAMRLRKPEAGYATDFVTHVMAPLAREIAEKKIKVVSNAGGVNPLACRDAVAKAAEAAGVKLKIAVVLGDDLVARADELRTAGIVEMDSGDTLPAKLVSMNAYLGAVPIARALAEGADVVITGRCVDSALVLGPLMHEFGWKADEFDRLAMGSLAGHILECGAQCNGGNFTDWHLVPDYDNMGFPIAEVDENGVFTVSKPAGTGGLITPATVGEQMLYEIGDPRAYLLPDVACDFTQVKMEQVAKDVVRVSGATGRPPTDTYKTSATYADGFKLTAAFLMGGIEASKKGHHIADAIVKRVRRMFRERNMGDFRDVSIETLGAEATYGPHARHAGSREVVVKIAARHDQKEALTILGREISPMGTGGVPGMTGFFGSGRATPNPVIRLFSCLVPKKMVPVEIDMDGRRVAVNVPTAGGFDPKSLPADPAIAGASPGADAVSLPLVALAYGRSGDKGDSCNIGIIARKPEYLPLIAAQVTEQSVAQYFAHRIKGKVTRWALPGIDGFNFLLRGALGGGGVASLQADPQGKAYAQMLLDLPVRVPAALAREIEGQKAA
ncbi:MAG: acyclic terpene utilization AtuA family protein [Reyranellaceae bacterium]